MKTRLVVQIAILLISFEISNASFNTITHCLGSKTQFSINQEEKPDLRKADVCVNIVLKKSSSDGYWLYHKPTNYYLKKDEDYYTIKIGSNLIIYIIEIGNYYIIEDYDNLTANVERYIKYSSSSDGIVIRSPGLYSIYYKGKYTDNNMINYCNRNSRIYFKLINGVTLSISCSSYYSSEYYIPLSLWF